MMRLLKGYMDRFCPLDYTEGFPDGTKGVLDHEGTIRCWDNRAQKERHFSDLEWEERCKEHMLVMYAKEDADDDSSEYGEDETSEDEEEDDEDDDG